MNKEEWVSWEYYLIWLGERLNDYSYTKIDVLDNLEYFKDCWEYHLSTYKALEFFSYFLDSKV